jgi:hypothetical protein
MALSFKRICIWVLPTSKQAFLTSHMVCEAKIQNDSIIWYANGDNPAPKGSTYVLNDSHGLVLTSPKGSELWRSLEFTSSRISRVLMKDDGNFQLRDINSIVLWQSFNNCTNTLVPCQTLNLNNYLYSRQGEFNFSHGRFELCLQKKRDVALLNLIKFPTDINCSAQHDAYFDSGIVDPDNESSNVGRKLIFDNFQFSLYILKKDRTKFYITNPKDYVTNGLYYKATINYDGFITLLYYPRGLKNSQRWVVAKTIP